MTSSTPRLYGDLAHLWPLMSPPEDYADEGDCWRRELRARLGQGRLRILDLGTGGGHHLHQITANDRDGFDATAVDLSEAMLTHSRRLNPDARHSVGDMRSVRLGETFDAVLIHDAIDYMLTEADLRAALASARAHLRPGGLLMAAPDDYAETFQPPRVRVETRRAGGKELTYVEYSADADPMDTRVETAYAFFFVEGGELRAEVDAHVTGLFPIAAWERLIREAGFAPQRIDYPFADDDRPMYLWVCGLIN